MGLLISSCSKEDSTNPNKFTINNTEYFISKTVLHTDIYESGIRYDDSFYFDLSFLTEGVEKKHSNLTGFSGIGSVFITEFINDTNTFLSDGEFTYTYPVSHHHLNLFDSSVAMAVTNYNFDNWNSEPTEEVIIRFKSAVFNVTRDRKIYTITGSGITSDKFPFTLYFKGPLKRDPRSH